MDNRTFYREIVNDHNLRPVHKYPLADANMQLRGVNPSCGDDITLYLKVENGVVADGTFTGTGCAISQASADMMLDLIIGRTENEAKELAEIFLRMIKGKVTAEELERLEEASALSDISHMPARVKCAVLGWHTMETLLNGSETDSVTTENHSGTGSVTTEEHSGTDSGTMENHSGTGNPEEVRPANGESVC